MRVSQIHALLQKLICLQKEDAPPWHDKVTEDQRFTSPITILRDPFLHHKPIPGEILRVQCLPVKKLDGEKESTSPVHPQRLEELKGYIAIETSLSGHAPLLLNFVMSGF